MQSAEENPIVDQKTFNEACMKGNFELAKIIYQKACEKNISILMRPAFPDACYHGDLQILEWMREKALQNQEQLYMFNNAIFRMACKRGREDVVKWLYTFARQNGENIDVHSDYYDAFEKACVNGHLTIAQWLHGVSPVEQLYLDIALYKALSAKQKDIALWLVDIGATITQSDFDLLIYMDKKNTKHVEKEQIQKFFNYT